MQSVRTRSSRPSTRPAGKRGNPYFVGREKETRAIIRALAQEKNVILSGKYGMGRSSLVGHVADTMHEGWLFVFVDFAQTPARASNDLFTALFPKRKRGSGKDYVRYKASRFQIANLDLEDERQHVLVLDNIGELSRSRQAFVRYLSWDSSFRFVAIVEAFVPKEDLFALRALLKPALTLSLGYLPASSCRAFFRHFSQKYHFNWAEERIASLVKTTGGYPLGMKEAVAREMAKHLGRA